MSCTTPLNFKRFEWPYVHWQTWNWCVAMVFRRCGFGITWDIRPRWESEYFVRLGLVVIEVSFTQKEN